MFIGCGWKGNFALVAQYEDDEEITFYGRDEDDCISQMAKAQNIHGYAVMRQINIASDRKSAAN